MAQNTTSDGAFSQRRHYRGNPQGARSDVQGRRRAGLETRLHTELLIWFRNRILPVTHAIADRWGVLEAQCQLRGTRLDTADGMIAATAIEHDLTVVTRNGPIAPVFLAAESDWNGCYRPLVVKIVSAF